MADAAKLHVRENKFNVGAHVSVSRQYFIEDASDSDARFYGNVVRVLSNDDARVKWVIDGTQSVVDPKELRVETQDIVDIETFKPAPHVDFGVDDENKESKIKLRSKEEKVLERGITFAMLKKKILKVNVPIHKSQRKKAKT